MNNEQREQQMMTAAEAYAEEVGYKDEHDLCSTLNVFCAGWRAADFHPHWIPVEERLPEENTAPLVRMDLTDKFDEETILYDVAVFDGNGFHTPYKVTHWMEIVPPRKEAKNE